MITTSHYVISDLLVNCFYDNLFHVKQISSIVVTKMIKSYFSEMQRLL